MQLVVVLPLLEILAETGLVQLEAPISPLSHHLKQAGAGVDAEACAVSEFALGTATVEVEEVVVAAVEVGEVVAAAVAVVAAVVVAVGLAAVVAVAAAAAAAAAWVTAGGHGEAPDW